MNKRDKIELTELFLAKSGWNRTFVGTIVRKELEDGTHMIFGTIPVQDYIITASAPNIQELGKKLDILVTLVLDSNIHNIDPKLIKIGEFFINDPKPTKVGEFVFYQN